MNDQNYEVVCFLANIGLVRLLFLLRFHNVAVEYSLTKWQENDRDQLRIKSEEAWSD